MPSSLDLSFRHSRKVLKSGMSPQHPKIRKALLSEDLLARCIVERVVTNLKRQTEVTAVCIDCLDHGVRTARHDGTTDRRRPDQSPRLGGMHLLIQGTQG